MHSRRSLLKCSILLSPVSLAGYLDGGNLDYNYRENIRLGGGQVFNGDSKPHQISVVIERNGAVVYESTASYSNNEGGNPGSIISGDWSSSPATYAVHASVDDEPTRTNSLEDDTEKCLELYVFVDVSGTLVVAVKPIESNRPYACSE